VANVLSVTSSAGTGGLTVANQIFNRFKKNGKPLQDGDIMILDNAYVRELLSFTIPDNLTPVSNT
jgi:hypothetical protein